MGVLHNKMSHIESKPNMRFFIAKLISNRPAAFQPWALHWFTPIMQVCAK